ncbi:MAG: universal stress protein [Xenococcaceae cyanobacterium]
MVFKKIMVALDRSPQAPVVFEQALELAKIKGGNLMVFHCLKWETSEPVRPFIGIGTLADVNMYGDLQKLRHESLQKDVEQVRGWLQNYCQQAASKGISGECDCRVGAPGSWICDRARNWGADLIVIGRRGHGGLSELLLGSVSNYVVHHASCSVLVVQGIEEPTIDMSTADTQEKIS